MKYFFVYLCLLKALKKPAPSLIPRSGEEGELVNCYSCNITLDNGSIFWVESIDKSTANGYVIEKETRIKTYKNI